MKPHPKPAADVPKWASLLVEAVNKPGMIMEAYSAFHRYSIANQILALVQCYERYVDSNLGQSIPFPDGGNWDAASNVANAP
jgi:hypothetical protein